MFKLKFKPKKERIYLDYASITPVDPRVAKEVSKTLEDFPANPSSLYEEGVSVRKKLEDARSRVANCLEVNSDEIYFTSGGTEANNLAIQGLLRSAHLTFSVPHIISMETEHPSVREILKVAEEKFGYAVTYVPVDESGIVDPREIKKALRPETVFVTVMYANNEIGVVQPIHEIAKVIRAFKKDKAETATGRAFPYFHTDACQAAAYESLRIPALGVDMLTLDGSKIYGPRGVGALYVRRGIKFGPLFYGGSQENSLRPGTENVAGAAGFALALELCQEEKEKFKIGAGKIEEIRVMRDELLECIKNEVPNVLINGDIKKRLPNNINICLKGIDAEFAVLKLDARGVCVSSVTSCRAMNEDSSSYVIAALGQKSGEEASNGSREENNCAKSSLRITLGRFTTKSDIEKAKKAIISVLTSMI